MSTGEIILYTTEDGQSKIQLKTMDGTVWLNQQEISLLFDKARSTIAEHISAIFSEKELVPERVCRNFRQTAADGKNYEVTYYNLDLILAVGYRVRSMRGTQFRQWATTTLREYLVKGFAMDDERLKEPGGWDYFDELLERIREIRASEKRFYQKVKDLFTLSVDYDGRAEEAQLFFQTVQNKMIWAITGRTAAELIIERSNPALPNMGLTTWQGGKVRKADVTISKNYLKEGEISDLNRIVTMFLDMAEDRATRRLQMTMQDWRELVDSFLKFNERDVLPNAGSISHERMELIAHERYEQFDGSRREHERLLAEKEHEQEIDAELKQLEGKVAKRQPRAKKKRKGTKI